MNQIDSCIFCQKKLEISTIKGSGSSGFLVACVESESCLNYAITRRGYVELTRKPSRRQHLIEMLKHFNLRYPNETPLICLDEKMLLSVIKLAN